MQRSLNTALLLVSLNICEMSSVASNDKFYIDESVEIFAAVLEELEKSYLGEIDKSVICTNALNALTGTLDPYTTYFPSTTDGFCDPEGTTAVGGIGVEISEDNGKKYISRIYKSSPAHKCGLQVGDEIVTIDKLPVKPKSIGEVIRILKGAPGTFTTVQVARFASQNLIAITIRRERLESYNIILSKILQGDIAYIRLQQFGEHCANEAKEGIAYFKSLGATKLILDLRDNEGGSIDEAVQILEEFLGQNSLIIRTAGKNLEFNKEYRTANEAPDATTPIVILVNEKSASAAEIVAGVMQEYDRAVIIGQQTFGKGTVQTIVNMPYGTQLKITTAKYILPSGRNILALGEAISPNRPTKFETKNGRIVYEQRGVIPDVLISQKSLSSISSHLLSSGFIRNYANHFRSEHRELIKLSDFKLSDKQYQDFIDWISSEKIKLENEVSLERILLDPRFNVNDNIKRQMRQLLFQIASANKQRLRHLKNEIKPLLEYAIVEQFHMYEGAIEFALENDPCLKEAMRLVKDKAEYKRILRLS